MKLEKNNIGQSLYSGVIFDFFPLGICDVHTLLKMVI